MARNLFLICLAFALAPFATAQALVPMPAQPDGQAWPTAGWETGELRLRLPTPFMPCWIWPWWATGMIWAGRRALS